MDYWEAFQRLGLALVLTLPLAVDRELRGKEAGLRTNVLVAVTCAALGYLSVLAAETSAGNDGSRIASQTVTGIGFIGAGIIWAAGGRVRGLTTAAAAFAAAAIGLVSGMGERALAITLAAAVLFILWPTHWVFRKLVGREARQTRLVQLVVRRHPHGRQGRGGGAPHGRTGGARGPARAGAAHAGRHDRRGHRRRRSGQLPTCSTVGRVW